MSRLRWHPRTQDMARRIAEGHGRNRIIRRLKRYVIRDIHRAITADLAHSLQPDQPATISA